MKAIIFDLDGTLIDSVYLHAISWQQTLAEAGLPVPAWQVHRYIGISGKLLVRALARPRHRAFSDPEIKRLEQRHIDLMQEKRHLQIPLPGAIELLGFLRQQRIPHGIATTGKRKEIEASLKALGIGPETPVIDGDETEGAKPEPDLFLACQERLAIPKPECVIVGDAVWDLHAARRAGISAVGLLTGGSSEQELFNAGAMRVYRDPAAVMQSIDEFGFELG